MKTARLYDPGTDLVTKTPLAEMEDGYVRAKIEGVAGTVYIHVTKLPGWVCHQPLDRRTFGRRMDAVWAAIREASRFTRAEWVALLEDESRLIFWETVARKFEHVTAGKGYPPAALRVCLDRVMCRVVNGTPRHAHQESPAQRLADRRTERKANAMPRKPQRAIGNTKTAL